MPQGHRASTERTTVGRRRPWLACTLMIASFILGGRGSVAYAQLNPGDILVVDVEAGTGGLGALFRVDPGTGMRSLLSGFGDPAHGPTGHDPIGVAVVPTREPFSTFAVAVDLTFSPPANADGFAVSATFTLGGGSDGMNPLAEVVGLQVGAFTTVIPAGAFSQDAAGQFTFAGVIGAAAVNVLIQPFGGGSFGFSATGTGADLTGSRLPVPVGLTIGDASGTAVHPTGRRGGGSPGDVCLGPRASRQPGSSSLWVIWCDGSSPPPADEAYTLVLG
jgi:hypothetical protein